MTQVPLYATLTVLVAADGKIERISIYKSSGDDKFDMASIRAAQKSLYKPKVVNCQPVEGTAVFRTSLIPGTPPP